MCSLTRTLRSYLLKLPSAVSIPSLPLNCAIRRYSQPWPKCMYYLVSKQLVYGKIILYPSFPCSGPNENSIYIHQNTRIQILETIYQLPSAEKDQCGAFIVPKFFLCLILPSTRIYVFFFFLPPPSIQRDESSLVVWSYTLEAIMPLCKDIDDKLINHIWRNRKVARRSSTFGGRVPPPPTANSLISARPKLAVYGL